MLVRYMGGNLLQRQGEIALLVSVYEEILRPRYEKEIGLSSLEVVKYKEKRCS